MTEFDGTVVIVTGASSGIGRATADRFAREGARVAVFARSHDALRELASGHGERMLAVAGDVASADDIERLFRETETTFGACEVLVNNAGMVVAKRMHEMAVDAWDRLFAVNVRGVFLASRRALPSMIEKQRGAIVNVSSISGVIGPEKFPGFTAYNSSKAAVIAMTEALAVEVRDRGVRVNCVSPGSVDTKMWAGVSGNAPAAMTPDEIAETILFLASQRSRPMNGQNLNVYSA